MLWMGRPTQPTPTHPLLSTTVGPKATTQPKPGSQKPKTGGEGSKTEEVRPASNNPRLPPTLKKRSLLLLLLLLDSLFRLFFFRFLLEESSVSSELPLLMAGAGREWAMSTASRRHSATCEQQDSTSESVQARRAAVCLQPFRVLNCSKVLGGRAHGDGSYQNIRIPMTKHRPASAQVDAAQ